MRATVVLDAECECMWIVHGLFHDASTMGCICHVVCVFTRSCSHLVVCHVFRSCARVVLRVRFVCVHVLFAHNLRHGTLEHGGATGAKRSPEKAG